MSGLSVRLPANTPTWLLALTVLALVVVAALFAAVRVARHVMPQDSADRLAWWRDRRAMCAECRSRAGKARLGRCPMVKSDKSMALPKQPIAARTERKAKGTSN